MKTLLLVLLFAVPTWAADIDFTFDYSYQTPGCADAAAVNCVESFEIRDQRDGLIVAIATATTGATTPAVDIPAAALSYPRLGNRTFAVYVIARGNEGLRIESLQSNEATAVIRPFPATNTRATQR